MDTIELVIRSAGDELVRLTFTAGDRPAQTEKSLRLVSWIVSGVTREEAKKRSSRADRAPRPEGDDSTPPE